MNQTAWVAVGGAATIVMCLVALWRLLEAIKGLSPSAG